MNTVKSKNSLPKIFFYVFGLIVLIFLFLILFRQPILKQIGQWIVIDEKPHQSEAAVVLWTGIEYYPRLIEAAELFNRGVVKK